ncbi:MAG: hypothetical protein LBH18_01280 [Spirochaetaceae bacterium]|nr:hypothetical protein [Spirochaetaceae bacterium]
MSDVTFTGITNPLSSGSAYRPPRFAAVQRLAADTQNFMKNAPPPPNYKRLSYK